MKLLRWNPMDEPRVEQYWSAFFQTRRFVGVPVGGTRDGLGRMGTQ